jgi:hypothetical protein
MILKNKITLLVLAIFIVIILSAVGIRKKIEQKDRNARLQNLHPILAFTLAFSDLTKIHLAAIENDAEKMEKLIEQGWAVDRRIRGNLTPLHIASMCGSSESAEVLIRHGADLNYENKEGVTPLAFAAIGTKRNMVELLLANGASADKKNKKGLTPAEVAQQWREGLAPIETSYYKEYGEQMDACIEILRQAANETERSDSNTAEGLDD